MREPPAADLVDRFPGPVTGTIADAGLRGPDELVALAGRAAGRAQAARRPEGRLPAGVTLAVFVAGFLAPLLPALDQGPGGGVLVLAGDLQRGTLVVLVGMFLLAATATGTAAAARILDHRRALRPLRPAGTPLGALDGPRRSAR